MISINYLRYFFIYVWSSNFYLRLCTYVKIALEESTAWFKHTYKKEKGKNKEVEVSLFISIHEQIQFNELKTEKKFLLFLEERRNFWKTSYAPNSITFSNLI